MIQALCKKNMNLVSLQPLVLQRPKIKLNQNGLLTPKKHTDDIYTVKSFTDVDECEVIKNINNWEIELIPNDNHLEEKNIPDWFGYMRIDKK